MTIFKPVQREFKKLRPVLIPIAGIGAGFAIAGGWWWLCAVGFWGVGVYIWYRG